MRYLIELNISNREHYDVINYSDILNIAAAKGKISVIEYLIDCEVVGVADYNSALVCAAGEGRLETMRLLKKLGADSALSAAAKTGNLATLKLLVQWGSTHYHEALTNAIRYSRINAIRLFISLGERISLAEPFMYEIYWSADINTKRALRIALILQEKQLLLI